MLESSLGVPRLNKILSIAKVTVKGALCRAHINALTRLIALDDSSQYSPQGHCIQAENSLYRSFQLSFGEGSNLSGLNDKIQTISKCGRERCIAFGGLSER